MMPIRMGNFEKSVVFPVAKRCVGGSLKAAEGGPRQAIVEPAGARARDGRDGQEVMGRTGVGAKRSY